MRGSSKVFSDILTRQGATDRRVNNMETTEYIKFYPILGATDYLIHTTINTGVTYTSANLRGVGGISATAKGFLGTLWITPIIATTTLQITPGNDTPGAYSQQYIWATTAVTNSFHTSQMVFCFLGPDGTIKIKATGANTEVFIVAFGYWG